MKQLYLVRHGETLFNRQKKIQGWCDSPLTDKGIKQCLKVKEYFNIHNITFDYAYCSTSERASDSLELMVDMPYIRLKELKEVFYGELEGESERLAQRDPKLCETYYLQFNGESANTVKDRMLKVLTEIMEKENHNRVLAVSHGGACFNFLRAIQDPYGELQKGFGNCCLFVYEFDNHQFKLKEVIRLGEES